MLDDRRGDGPQPLGAWDIDLTMDHPSAIDPIIDGDQTLWFAFSESAPPLVRVRENTYDGGRFNLGLIQTHGYEVGTNSQGYLGMSMPLSGHFEFAKKRGDFRADPDNYTLHAFGPMRTRLVRDGAAPATALSFAFSDKLFAEWTDVLDGEARWIQSTVPGSASLLALRVRSMRDSLLEIVRMTDAGLPPAPALSSAWMHEQVLDLQLALENTFGRPSRASAGLKQVRAAEDFIEAHSAEPIHIPAVARHVGLSLRALQMAFIRHRGHTPKWALTRARLENARRLIINGSPERTVTDIAMDCGFWHLSRFAIAYRQRFGRPPSADLARKRPTMMTSFRTAVRTD